MAGLLGNGFDDPQSQMILGLAQGLLSGRGGQGLAAGLGNVQNVQDNIGKQKLMDMQISNFQSEIEARKLAGVKDARQQALIEGMFGGGPGRSDAGQMPTDSMAARTSGATGSGGGLVDMAKRLGIPDQAIQADMVFNGGKGIAAMLEKHGSRDMQVTNGYAYDKNNTGSGFMPFLNTSASGQTTMGRIGSDGLPVVSAPNGALTTANDYALQGARIGSMGKVNMRKNADGTESPIPESSENTALFPGGGGDGFPTSATAPGSYQQANPKRNLLAAMPGESDAQGIYGRAFQEAQQRLKMARTPEDAARANSDIAGIQSEMGKIGLRSPQAAAGPVSYGMTNDQVIANKVKDETAVGTAKADVQSTQGRQAGMDGAMNAFKLVDQALLHPGLSTAVGLSGTLDPRNYIPGTDAKNFDAIAKQLKGNAFLSAFAQLKGGGAITEVEGAKAEAAIARLQQSQSQAEYRSALKDYQQVIGQGLRRMGVDPANMGGATGSFGDKPPKTVVKTGLYGGKKVVQYSDGSTDYAN